MFNPTGGWKWSTSVRGGGASLAPLKFSYTLKSLFFKKLTLILSWGLILPTLFSMKNSSGMVILILLTSLRELNLLLEFSIVHQSKSCEGLIEKRLNKMEAQRLMSNLSACTFKLWCNSLHPTRNELKVQGLFASTHSLFCKYLNITLFVLKSDRSFDLCNQKVHYIEMQGSPIASSHFKHLYFLSL